MDASHALDAYSQIVSGVAEQLTPKVASLRVPHHGPAERARASARAWSSPATGSC